jgi:alkyldihydroxyacetonephosphate synthase
MTRERSFWGWGYADRFPDTEARRGMAEHARGILGVGPLEVQEPPTLDSIRMPPSRIEPPPGLSAFVTSDRKERALHTYGRAYRDLLRAFRGDFTPAPDLVAHVRTEEDILAIFEWAKTEGITVIPFGGGTSVVGGVERPPSRSDSPVVSVNLRAMDRVLDVDVMSRAARIQAGATGPRLEEQLAPHGLTLRHFPQSFELSTLGGWIVTRAGGHFATLYTHIDDLVESVRMLTPRGVWESRRLPASGAGPSPDRLVLGSEGILGIVTEAWVRLQSRPRYRESATFHFASFESAVAAVRELSQSGLHPSNCRLLDAQEARINMVTGDGSSVLIVAFESADHPLGAWLDRAMEIASSHGGTCPRGPQRRTSGDRSADATADAWKSAFVDAPYLQSALVSLGVIADTFETACTWDRFDALHRAVREAVIGTARSWGASCSVSCRFTHVYPDGPAPYYTFVTVPPSPGGELEAWAKLKCAASDALIEHGATITHHHAVGRTHRPHYDRERPEPFAAALRAIKRELDPTAMLNPGVLIDP